MVVIDATNLLLMLRPGTPVPAGPDGVAIKQPKERIEYLIQRLNKEKTKIIIPTPALSEALVRAGRAASQEIVERLQKYAVFRIEPSIRWPPLNWPPRRGNQKTRSAEAGGRTTSNRISPFTRSHYFCR